MAGMRGVGTFHTLLNFILWIICVLIVFSFNKRGKFAPELRERIRKFVESNPGRYIIGVVLLADVLMDAMKWLASRRTH